MQPDQTIPAFVSLTGPQALCYKLFSYVLHKKVLYAARDIRKIVHAAKYNVATVLC